MTPPGGPPPDGPPTDGRLLDGPLLDGPLLDGRVVVVSGVGPDLGQAIALRCARAGADVVLAARTASRLDDVAKEVTALGRRAAAVPTDITDEDSAAGLAEAALAAFGRVDTLVNNAFAIPPLAALADTGLDAIRAAFETNVLAALRLTRLFTPALASSGGSVVMINSAVLRHSRVSYGGYKMAKSALLSLAQSLATELGPQGIRVNSVAPGWIWGSTLQWYFGYLADQRGIGRQEIYDETAATTDLRRLPEPDEIADAVVFLASPLARAITGQCLDVNCGEFHH
jgi:NAD(P)-dependent dehydrogenase (short-subunit alcohol dehydrogenase family)